LLLGRFIWLQVIQHDFYQTRAEDNRIALIPIVPNRGVITDRNGIVLARNYSAFTLEITPSQVPAIWTDLDRCPGRGHRYPAQGPQALQARARRSEEFRVDSHPDPSDRCRSRPKFAAQRYPLSRVEVKARLFRQYPLGSVASHAIGYIGRITDRDLKLD
jgi:penicillin-binding protein 2